MIYESLFWSFLDEARYSQNAEHSIQIQLKFQVVEKYNEFSNSENVSKLVSLLYLLVKSLIHGLKIKISCEP